jgi:hypothetical protein
MAVDETFLKALGAAAALALMVPIWAWLSGADPSAGPSGSPARSPPAPAFTLKLSADRGHVDLEGRIDFGVTADLTALLEEAPGVHTLRLQSPGGRVAEARGLVTVVERFALATQARGDCASACTLVFIAGHSRALDPGARLGFHGYDLRSPVFGLLDPATELARDSAIFHAAGVDEAFTDRAMAVPHREMWFPTRDDLIGAGVIDPG